MEGKRKIAWYIRWFNQVRLLLWKNALIFWRLRRSTLIQVLVPPFFIFILWIINISLGNNTHYQDFYEVVHHPPVVSIPPLPECIPGPDFPFCVTIAYAPNNSSLIDSIINEIVRENNLNPNNIRSFSNAFAVDDFLYNYMNTTQNAIIFFPNNTNNETVLDYILQGNQTNQHVHGQLINNIQQYLVPLQYYLDKAILKIVGNASLTVNTINTAHPQVLTLDLIGANGPTWFFAALMFNFVAGLGNIVLEKEQKLREIMKLMGLYDSAYWLTWFITLLVFSTWTVLSIITFGCIFQFQFFLMNAFGLYFFLMELFALSLISMAFLISTLVKKASNATNVGFLIFIIGFFFLLGGAFLFSTSVNAPLGVRVLFALFSPSMFELGLNELGSASSSDISVGLRWDQRSSISALQNGNYSFNDMYGWLFLDFVIYFLIALYLDNVLPNEYGVKRPLYYFLTPSYWSGKSHPFAKKMKKVNNKEEKVVDEDVKAEEEAIQHDQLPENTQVIIKDLTKIYPGTKGICNKKGLDPYVAVDNLNLSIQADTLLALLGPNGAGKTTSIHMLVGFHEATSGDATIFGYSIRENIDSVRSILGICPQFDILWNELTGEEHLKLFAGLRDIPSSQISAEIDRLLAEVELTEARKMRSSSYSGGMKRRLSVAISMIGDPKIIFLDEPTTGMDPVSRRSVWNTIERTKKDKVIILTTHSMEEADVLGDRIAIMGKGRLQCLGSSLRLKQKFGAGYRVTIGTDEKKVDLVQQFFKENIPSSALIGNVISGYMNFGIPRDQTSTLVPFFKKLANDKSLGIYDIQLSLTTLEEVFLTVAEHSELQELQEQIKTTKDDSNSSPPEEQKEQKEEKDLEAQTKERSRVSYLDQFRALFIKNIHLQSREKKTLVCQALTPFFLVLLLYAFNQLITYLINSPTIPDIIHPFVTPPFQLLTKPQGEKLYDQNPYTLQCFELPNDVIPNLEVTGTQLFITGNNNTVLDRVNTFNYTTKFIPFVQYGNLVQDIYEACGLPLDIHFVNFATRPELDDAMFNNWGNPPHIAGGYQFNNIDFNNRIFDFNVIFNNSLTYWADVPFLLNRITASIGSYLGISMKYLGVKQFPTLAAPGFTVDVATLAGSFFYELILLLLLPVFLANIAYEKESKIKEMMKMMGLKVSIYWLVHYLFDFTLYLFQMFFLIIAGWIFKFPMFTINNFFSYFMLFFLWGHVLVAFSFMLSVFFSSKKTATISGYFIVLGFSLVCAILIDPVVGNVLNVSPVTRSCLSIIPPFNLYRGLIYLNDEVAWGGYGFTLYDLSDPVVNMAEVYGWCVAHWVIMMLLWLYLEQVIPSSWGVKKHPLFCLMPKKKKNTFSDLIEKDQTLPVDVEAEKNRVFEPNAEEKYGILVRELRKVYPGIDGNPPKVAVKGVSFAISENSCLGILGHNGAGKSTLIHMLIGLVEPTLGTAVIYQNDLIEELATIHTFMGICPQHDILWETLTGKEHLMFYGRIKGLSGKALKEEVRKRLHEVNLYDARNKLSKQYSGGMKRRLSVAISLMASPKVLYLDEPSTGLDPKSRQDLWQVIQRAKKTSSIIMTTHSMEEADALCDRLVIMSHGEMKAIGPSADLKNRFGAGFKLSFQVARGKSDIEADQFVRNLVPGAVQLNELAGTRNYEVPKGAVKLEKVFEEMENNKARLNITDWAITNTTLEEVFLHISLDEGKEKLKVSVNQKELIEEKDIDIEIKQEEKKESEEEEEEEKEKEESEEQKKEEKEKEESEEEKFLLK